MLPRRYTIEIRLLRCPVHAPACPLRAESELPRFRRIPDAGLGVRGYASHPNASMFAGCVNLTCAKISAEPRHRGLAQGVGTRVRTGGLGPVPTAGKTGPPRC